MDRHDPGRIGDRPGREREGIEDGEERGVQADRGRQRGDGHRREPGLVRRRSKAVAEVLPGAVEPREHALGAGVLAGQGQVAHDAPALRGGVGCRETGVFEPGLRHGAVALDLFGELAVDVAVTQRIPEAAKEVHGSPALSMDGYAESRTCWMAPINRWNSLRSEARRLRPAAVSV